MNKKLSELNTSTVAVPAASTVLDKIEKLKQAQEILDRIKSRHNNFNQDTNG